jgi:NADPH:quinone reductase-like Zn-dependent oxidoreductase
VRRAAPVASTARPGAAEVLDVVDLPDPVPGDGRELCEVSAAGVNAAGTHHDRSWDSHQGHGQA